MKKILKISLITLLIIGVVGFAGFYFWSQQTYDASEELHTYVKTDGIQQEENWLVFEPAEQTKGGVILYPGAKVEPKAYSYYAQDLADNGYTVIIPKVTFNFAIFDVDQASLIMKEFSEIDNWYVGGHSLGGVAAASYAFDHPEEISGIIFLASYPSDSDDFSKTEMPILSLYAEHDGLTTLEKINDTKHLLSPKTTLYEVKGGNHAQFGMYGKQKGDGEATISAKEQQDEIVLQTVQWLNKAS